MYRQPVNPDDEFRLGRRSRYSISQMQQLRDKSADIEKAALLRWQLEREHQQQLAAAQAIRKLSSLSVADPDYAVKRAKILSEHPDALGSPTLQKVLATSDADYKAYQSHQDNYNQELFRSTTAKRLAQVAGNPLVPTELKSQLLNNPLDPTSVNMPVLEQAESFLQQQQQQQPQNKQVKSFYQSIEKRYGLTPDDLDSINMTGQGPDAVKYVDSEGTQVSSDDVKGRESQFKAQFPLANGDLKTIPLDKFQDMMRMHEQFQAQAQSPDQPQQTFQPNYGLVPFRLTPATPLNAEGFSAFAEGTPGQNAIRAQIGLPPSGNSKSAPAQVDLKSEIAKYLGTISGPVAATPAITPQQSAGGFSYQPKSSVPNTPVSNLAASPTPVSQVSSVPTPTPVPAIFAKTPQPTPAPTPTPASEEEAGEGEGEVETEE